MKNIPEYQKTEEGECITLVCCIAAPGNIKKSFQTPDVNPINKGKCNFYFKGNDKEICLVFLVPRKVKLLNLPILLSLFFQYLILVIKKWLLILIPCNLMIITNREYYLSSFSICTYSIFSIKFQFFCCI